MYTDKRIREMYADWVEAYEGQMKATTEAEAEKFSETRGFISGELHEAAENRGVSVGEMLKSVNA
tara:strand:+ start:2344 stop:2538 length:195 start_codon:yes stop_codon:yes gene_type:complete